MNAEKHLSGKEIKYRPERLIRQQERDEERRELELFNRSKIVLYTMLKGLEGDKYRLSKENKSLVEQKEHLTRELDLSQIEVTRLNEDKEKLISDVASLKAELQTKHIRTLEIWADVRKRSRLDDEQNN